MKNPPLTETDAQLRLVFRKLKTRLDVATLLHITVKQLNFLTTYRAAPRYRSFELPKKSGGTRHSDAPERSLKDIQQRLNQVLQAVYRPKSPAHGSVLRRSLASNAAQHLSRRLILNVDLKDFFPTIHFGRVRGLFMGPAFGLPEPAARALAQVCVYRRTRPQGAPTSPTVSNMVCGAMDAELLRFATAHGCRYTRYADDISFSTNRDVMPHALLEATTPNTPLKLGAPLIAIFTRHSFAVNDGKIRLRGPGQRKEVTGLVVNEKLNVPRGFVRDIRGMLHAWDKYGENAAAAALPEHYRHTVRPGKKLPSFRKVLLGKLAYLSMVKGKSDPVFINLWNRLSRLDPNFTARTEVHSEAKVSAHCGS